VAAAATSRTATARGIVVADDDLNGHHEYRVFAAHGKFYLKSPAGIGTVEVVETGIWDLNFMVIFPELMSRNRREASIHNRKMTRNRSVSNTSTVPIGAGEDRNEALSGETEYNPAQYTAYGQQSNAAAAGR